jgi:galactokinase/mevalonate kinase-like predicted kinase
MSAWDRYWVRAFAEILELIEIQIRRAKKTADSISKEKTSRRFEVESHILWSEKKEIRRKIANTPFKRKLELMLAAFAYASKLVEAKDGIEGYVGLIKQRVSRISRSPEKRSEEMWFAINTSLAMLR